MTPRIMLLNMLKLRRAAKRLDVPVQFPQPLMQMRKPAPDIGDVALEVLHVDGVEAHDGGVQPYIRFGDLVAVVIWVGVSLEMLLSARQSFEQWANGGFVGLLRGGEAGLVDAIVDLVVGPFVRLVDLCAQRLGVQIHIPILFREQVVELGIEHADDLAGLVADDFALLGVVQRRYGEAAFVVRVNFKVDFTQVSEVLVDGVRRHVVAGEGLVRGREAPALFEHVPVDACVGDEGFEAFEFANDQGAVGPWDVSGLGMVM